LQGWSRVACWRAQSYAEHRRPDIAELRDELHLVVQMLELLVCAARDGEAASFKVKKFLARNDLSESQYHKLRRQGRGPRVMSVGSCGVRISRQAELDWIVAREAEAPAKEAALTETETGDPEGRPNEVDCNDPLRAGRKVPDECDMARYAP
jgi:hypothetical protein